MGDADAVKSTALGMKNLQRVAKMLMPATAWKEGETYDDLTEVYGRMLSQWQTEMNHVAQIVGGFNSQEKAVGQEGRIFTLVPKDPPGRSREVPGGQRLHDAHCGCSIRRFCGASKPVGAHRPHPQRAAARVLNNLLNSAALRAPDRAGSRSTAPPAYSPAEFLATVRKGVWKELDAPQVKIDAYRRDLQHSYLDLVNTKLNPPPAAARPRPRRPHGGGRGGRGGAPASGDEKPMYRAELRALNASITAAHSQGHRSRNQGASGRRSRRDRQDPRSEIPAARPRRWRRWRTGRHPVAQYTVS